MSNFRFKDLLPKSLMGRSILILVIPILVIQLVVGFFFLDRLFGNVSKSKTSEVIAQIEYFLSNPDLSNALSLDKAGAHLGIRFLANDIPDPSDSKALDDISGRYVIDEIHQSMDNVLFVDLLSDPDLVQVGLDAPQGPVLVQFARSRASARNPHQLLVAMTLASLLMTAIAIYFLRLQIKPIRLLARSAEAFGKGRNIPFHPRGAVEVRAAGNSFLAMRDRIERQIDQRTMMLSGVSHDLRTPLTRMSLSVSMMDQNSDTAEIQKDINDMSDILDEFLAFSKGDSGEKRQIIDVGTFANGLVENVRRAGKGINFDFKADETVYLNCRETALTRALENLLSNASRYGNTVKLSVKSDKQNVCFIVEDDGPGIPASAYDQALKPFVRLDESRNQDQGTGAGLGLAITADVARSHGGQLILGQSSSLGGLQAEISIPR